MITSFVSIGSNIEPRFNNCLLALSKLSEQKKIKVICASPWYESKPVKPAKPTDSSFINGVVKIETSLDAFQLLELCKSIERTMGRVKPVSGEPRIIDLDIILYGDKVINEQNLIIPHPRIEERLFVLIPICDISPDTMHPVLNKKFIEILNNKIKLGGENEDIHRYC